MNHWKKASARSGLFVNTWNVCQCAAAMMPNTAAIASNDSDSWNRSDIEFTKIRRGRFHLRGYTRISGTITTSPFQRPFVMTCSYA